MPNLGRTRHLSFNTKQRTLVFSFYIYGTMRKDNQMGMGSYLSSCFHVKTWN